MAKVASTPALRRKEMITLRLGGATYAEIAKRVGLSAQRVQQLCSPGKPVRDEVIIAARGCCQQCGIGVGRGGHVHHRKAFGLMLDDYNDLRNLRLLCPSCHRAAHGVDPRKLKRARAEERRHGEREDTMSRTGQVVKRALRRDPNVPIGQPSPLHVVCGCGRAVPIDGDGGKCVSCKTVYEVDGTIVTLD